MQEHTTSKLIKTNYLKQELLVGKQLRKFDPIVFSGFFFFLVNLSTHVVTSQAKNACVLDDQPKNNCDLQFNFSFSQLTTIYLMMHGLVICYNV